MVHMDANTPARAATVDAHRIVALSARLQGLAGSLRVANGQIQEELDALDRAVAILQSRWSGEAQDAYDEAQSSWTARLAEMNRVLSRITSHVSTADEAYRAASRKIGRVS